MSKLTSPTETSTEFNHAYDYFNDKLFGGRLPSCVITLHRHKKAYGYFWGHTWAHLKGEIITDEIVMNPDHFRDRSTAEMLSTLVHEMCHLQQHHVGKPSRGGYHNKEWALMMEAVGLIPSDTAEAGGKRTGQKVSHYIQPGGPFDLACTALLDGGYTLPWAVRTAGEEEVRKTKAAWQ